MYSAASPKENFDVVIPDANRYAATFGFTYPITKKLEFGATYLLELFEKRSIQNREYLAKNKVSNDGEYISFVHGFMTGFTYKFDKQLGDEKEAKVETPPPPKPIVTQPLPPQVQ